MSSVQHLPTQTTIDNDIPWQSPKTDLEVQMMVKYNHSNYFLGLQKYICQTQHLALNTDGYRSMLGEFGNTVSSLIIRGGECGIHFGVFLVLWNSMTTGPVECVWRSDDSGLANVPCWKACNERLAPGHLMGHTFPHSPSNSHPYRWPQNAKTKCLHLIGQVLCKFCLFTHRHIHHMCCNPV